jgi:hypothetical protein
VPETRRGFRESFPEATRGRVNTAETPLSNRVHRLQRANPHGICLALGKFNKFLARQTSSGASADVSLRQNFEELCGFAFGVQGLKPVDSLVDLFTPQLIRGFALWLTTEHGCKRTSIVGRIGAMVNAIRYNPCFHHVDFSWVYDVLADFTIEDPEELRLRRRTKEVAYDLLTSMLEQMGSERHALNNPSAEELAWRIHDELLILWMTTFPWYPRCIREARVLGAEPNIFKVPAPHLDATGIPPWAIAEFRHNARSTSGSSGSPPPRRRTERK